MKKGKMSATLWVLMAAVSGVILFLASVLYPYSVVFGNDRITVFISVVLTAVLLDVVLSLVVPVTKTLKLKLKSDLNMGVAYTVANIIGLWVLARIGLYIGFGIASYKVAVVLGIILSVTQYAAWKEFGGKKK